jgi:hypothetical protein
LRATVANLESGRRPSGRPAGARAEAPWRVQSPLVPQYAQAQVVAMAEAEADRSALADACEQNVELQDALNALEMQNAERIQDLEVRFSGLQRDLLADAERRRSRSWRIWRSPRSGCVLGPLRRAATD